MLKTVDTMAMRLTELAERRAEDLALVCVDAQGDHAYTYAQLHRRALGVAGKLSTTFERGTRALILLDSGVDYVTAFFGCLYAGIIAVPAFPPESSKEQHLDRLRVIAADAGARCILTSALLAQTLHRQFSTIAPDALVLGVDGLPRPAPASIAPIKANLDDIAFLQYTSGSTSDPKGVMVTHGNLMANEAAIRERLQVGEDDVFASWLPLYHDMGLIGALMQPFYRGIPLVLMSPRFFLENPIRWLEAISRHRATISGGPDFSFRLCVDRITDAALGKLDLSSWRVAFSGSEPVRYDTLEAFFERFRPVGFRPSAVYPCYGLAEATLLVTGVARDAGVIAPSFDSSALSRGHVAEKPDDARLVACGSVAAGHALRVVEPASQRDCADGVIGEIWFSGPSVAAGYWRNQEATGATFIQAGDERWLRTGDLGFVHGGQLYVAGRLKDLIIVRGQNTYPQDIERSVEAEFDFARKGRVAAFAVNVAGREGIGLALEIAHRSQKLASPEAIVAALNEIVSAAHGEPLSVAVLLNPGALPKTSSGKLRRGAARQGYQDDSLDFYAVYENGRFRASTNGAVAARSDTWEDDTQRRLAQLWTEILGTAVDGAHANYFGLGGNSLTGVQLVARVREIWSIGYDLADLFESPRLRDAAARIDRLARDGAAVAIPAAAREAEPVGHFPLTAGQRQQWFLWKLEPDNSAYHIPVAIRIEGEVDEPALRNSLMYLASRHASLLTVFYDGADGPQQTILDSVPLPWRCVDLRGRMDKQAALDEGIRAAIDEPFDLTRAPLFRVALFDLGVAVQVLLLVVHHILADGQSMQVLVDELSQSYRAFRSGISPELEDVPIGYIELAARRDSQRGGPDFEAGVAYWKAQLGDAPRIVDFNQGAAQGYDTAPRARILAVAIEPGLVADVRRLARESGVTPAMVFLAAFYLALRRNTGNDDISIGVPISARSQSGLERVVGFLVDTQVIRVALDGATPLRKVLAEVFRVFLEARRHGNIPIDAIVEALQPDRETGRNPLFQVAFNYIRTDLRELNRVPGWRCEEYPVAPARPQFDLTLDVRERADDDWRGIFTYAEGRVDADTVERMEGHFLSALRGIVRQPDAAIGETDLLTRAEHRRLREWCSIGAAWPQASLVHHAIEAWAAHAPQAVALVYGDQALSYQELNVRANRLAHHLVGLGVGPEVKVGVALERSAELVVGLLAVLKAGGAYVPLDPSYPADRLAYMMTDSGLELVLTQASVAASLPLPEGVVALEVDKVDLSGEPETDPDVPVYHENLAYVIYTSGSTGRPKGAQLTHRNVARLLAATDAWFGFRPSDVWTLFHSYAFDFSVWEVFGALCHGGKLVVVPQLVSRSPDEFLALLRREGVTVLNQTPSAFRQLMQVPGVYDGGLSLRTVIFGGEALDPRTLGPWIAQYGDAQPRPVNMYGITETTVHVTYRPITQADVAGERSPVGRQIPDLGLYVLDGDGNLVPAGVAGELHVAGDGLARGYLNRAGLTAERFVPDPFSEDGGRLYRTGDLTRWNGEGQLEYLGRIDQQVKIRGFRIELGEVEAQLQAQAGVRESVVTAQEGPAGIRLVGYVTAQAGEVLDSATLRVRLGAVLPEYMVPSVVVVLDVLPLTANGKVDRKALPAPEFVSVGYEVPVGEIETALAGVWRRVLGVPRAGRNDNFFELGGDSILSLRMVSEARRAGLSTVVRQLFEHQTLQALAAAIGDQAVEEPISVIPEMQRRGLPLSHAQQRQWFLWNLQPQGSAYHIAGGLRFQGGLDVAAVRASFDVLVQRHESLRTTFEQRDEGMAVQVIHDSLPYDYAFTDLTGDTDPQARLKHVTEKFGRRPFDLTKGPLLRIEVIRLAEAEHVLLVSMHHIVSDGWSIGVLLKEFVQAYQANLDGLEVSLPAMPIQYADYAVWQRGWLEAGEQERQLAYWRDYLGQEHPVLELPVDHPRLTLGQYGEARVPIELPDDLVSRIRKCAHSQGATPFIVLLSALQILLHRYSGQTDIRVGIPNANRDRHETQGLIGFFVNMQVIRTRINEYTPMGRVLDTVKHGVQQAQTYQELPFDVLLDALQPERSLSRTPLFQVMHNHQHGGDDVLGALPGLRVGEYDIGERGAQFELTLNTSEHSDGNLSAYFAYAKELFEQSTIEQFSGHYVTILRALVEEDRDAVLVGEVDLLDVTQKAKLLSRGQAAGDYAALPLVHHQIESMALHRPDAIALIYGDVSLSYAELNERANRLAHHLIGLGVSPETKVGVALERSMELVVALLAVLKAGGAYVPLDPSYPAERLAYMMSDSGLALILTQSTVRDALPLPEDVAALELDRLDVNGLPHRNPAVKVHPENLAYVIYTSGSTGQPKGVMVRHAALSNFLRSMTTQPGLNDDDVLLAVTSLSFDIAALELYLPLVCGARLLLAQADAARDGAELRQLIQRHGVTVMQSTPSGWQLFLAGGNDRLEIKGLSGGEALPAELARRLHDAGVTLWNMYGPTETTIWSMVDRVTGPDIGLGHPVRNTHVYVLDAGGQLAPPGVAGEVHLGGQGLARGYQSRAGLTAERFVPNPLDVGGSRLYRTGDLARWTAKGMLEYLGRIDYQVKIRGFRIELGELEAQLHAQSGVREAVVTALEGPSGTRLVAYVTAQAGHTLEAQTLRAKLGELLPEYMVPSAIMALEALPLTPNGKVDRKRLPRPEFASQDYEAPLGEVEEALARIWQDILGVEQVGRHDNFFQLGGDSISSTRFVSRARAEGWKVQLSDVFRRQTIADLSMVTEADIPIQAADHTNGSLSFEASNSVVDGYPLSPMQMGLVFHSRFAPNSAMYVSSTVYEISAELDVDRFQLAWDSVLAQHTSLKAEFFESLDGEIRQRVNEDARMPVQFLDWSDAGEEGIDTAVESLLRAERSRSFHLDRAPLMWASLIRLPSQQYRFILHFHHILMDGWSAPLLFSAFCEAYECGGDMRHSTTIALRAEQPSFWDFLGWIQNRPAAEDLDYWRKVLDGYQPATSGSGVSHPSHDVYSTYEIRLQVTVTELEKYARDLHVTRNVVMQGGWALLASAMQGTQDVVFGVAASGRPPQLDGIERVIGLFINALPARVWVDPEAPLSEWLWGIHCDLAAMMQHQHTPLAEIQLACGITAGTSLFDALLAYQNYPKNISPTATEVASSLKLKQIRIVEQPHYPLNVRFLVDDDVILNIVFDRTKFTEESVAGMASQFESLLVSMLEGKAKTVGEINRATAPKPAAVQALAHSHHNDTMMSLHQRVLAHAKRRSKAVAISQGDTQLTYGELDKASQHVASQLRAAGIGPETIVGVSTDRSPALIVAILAILRVGAAYLPLDPSYPKDRLKYMLADSGAKIILSQRQLRERLQSLGASLILVDEALEIDVGDVSLDEESSICAHAANMAYVIYTSGSTGDPKGVVVTHDNVCRLLDTTQPLFRFDKRDVWSLYHSYSFDFSVWEIFGALTHGGRLVIVPQDTARDPEAFSNLIISEGITVLNQTPSAFRQTMVALLNEVEQSVDLPLRYVIFGGEALDLGVLTAWFDRLGFEQPKLLNMYGITETTVHVSFCEIDRPTFERKSQGSPIGGPLPDLKWYVLDDRLEKVKPGTPGEIYVSGPGLARGYLLKPAFTAGRYIPDPYGEAEGGRLYKTGDLARWTSDNHLEYIGRSDQQVKLRGFRIELGEVSAAARGHAAVQDAEAVVIDTDANDRRLTLFVVPDLQGIREQAEIRRQSDDPLASNLAEDWEEIFDTTYETAPFSPSFVGWNSSYSDRPIPFEEMNEWLLGTVRRIKDLRPRKVLEIGCGLGLVLQHIAPACESYTGIDFSQSAISNLTQWVAKNGYTNVKLFTSQANQLADCVGGPFDTIIINSVAQYFPSWEYFHEVLGSAVSRLTENGAIFLGDLRPYANQASFHTAIQMARASGDLSVQSIRHLIEKAVMEDDELLIDAQALRLVAREAGLLDVEVRLKDARYANELSAYRYDALLTKGHRQSRGASSSIVAMPDGADFGWVRDLLSRATHSSVRIIGVPNSRVMADVALVRALSASSDEDTVLAANRAKMRFSTAGLDPSDLYRLGDEHGWSVETEWGSDPDSGLIDVHFYRPSSHEDGQNASANSIEQSEYLAAGRTFSEPVVAKYIQSLSAIVRDHLRSQLPPHMVPPHIVVLPRIPLTANGKLDRGLLREYGAGSRKHEVRAASTDIERAIAEVWREILGIDGIGVDESFFELGGHSILAVQMTARVRKACGIELPLGAVFSHPSIAELAAFLEIRRDSMEDAVPRLPFESIDRNVEMALAPQQVGLWVACQFTAEPALYNIVGAFEIRGKLDRHVLRASFADLMFRHEILRTRYPDMHGRPTLSIDVESVDYVEVEVLVSDEIDGRKHIESVLSDFARISFDLVTGPLWRARVYEISTDRHIIAVSMHHLIADGWSLGILLDQLSSCYRLRLTNKALDIPPSGELQYVDFGAWHEKLLSGVRGIALRKFWANYLADFKGVAALPGQQAGGQYTPAANCIDALVPWSELKGLDSLCIDLGVTLFTVLLSAHLAVLHRLTGAPDIVVGVDVAGRDHGDTQRMVGYFVNVVPVRSTLANSAEVLTFRDFSERTAKSLRTVLDHAELPTDQIVQCAREAGIRPAGGLINSLFVMQNFPTGNFRIEGLDINSVDVAASYSKFGMEFFLTESSNGLKYRCHYSKALFGTESMPAVLRQWRQLIKRLVNSPETKFMNVFPDIAAVGGRRVDASVW